MVCSPPGSSVHGIFQARILEWVAIPFSRVSSQPKDQTQVSHTAGRFFTVWATRDNLAKVSIKPQGNYFPSIFKQLLKDMLYQREGKQTKKKTQDPRNRVSNREEKQEKFWKLCWRKNPGYWLCSRPWEQTVQNETGGYSILGRMSPRGGGKKNLLDHLQF